MSKKIIYSKHLLKGKFYLHGDHKGGHPAYLYKKRDNKNMYFVILFTSKKNSGRVKLKRSINPDSAKDSYALSKPAIAKRRDLSRNELTKMRIDKVDKPAIEVIKRKK